MFPPPRPWKQVSETDPEREYVAFTSRFMLKSPLRVPAFMRHSFKIMNQANAAPGIVGWSLAANLPKLEFHTLSAWEDIDSLRAFVATGVHGDALARFEGDMRADSIFVNFKVLGKDLPLRWPDAIALQDARRTRSAASN